MLCRGVLTDRRTTMPPLSDVRVVALEQAVSVPLATRHLADLGADVIKIERPDGGDFARGYDRAVAGQSVYFVWLNRGKRSIVLDLKDASDLATAQRLADSADVFVQNLGPGAAERAGLGAAVLRQRNPRLIYCSLTGYGDSGPYRERRAYDLLIQGETGAAAVSGTPEAPAKIGISVVDIAGGMYVLSSVLAALHERGRTGTGIELHVSLFDAISEWMSAPLLLTKYGAGFERTGLFHNVIAPYGPFSVGSEGTVMLAVQNQREWERLCTAVLERPELVTDPRFAVNEVRYRNREELRREIEAAFALLGLAATLRRLEAAAIAFGELRQPEDLQHHPLLPARDRWLTVDTPGGPVELLRPPFAAASGWETPPARVPALGEHTAEIMQELEAQADPTPPADEPPSRQR
jgi:itaconate CoA-transferase